MFWKRVKSISIAKQLLAIYILTTVLILSIITGLVYPPLKILLHNAVLANNQPDYLLTKWCLKLFFSGLWVTSGIAVIAGYFLSRQGITPIAKLSKELENVNSSALSTRLKNNHYPKELGELIETCNNMLERIEQGFQNMKQLSAAMAHELKTPIHYLKTSTEVTLSSDPNIENYQKLLESHLEAYQDLTRLMDDLLFMTRCENNLIPLKPEEFSLKEVVQTVVDFYQYVAKEKQIDLSQDGDAILLADKHLFKRVISNLLDNSLIHCSQGDKVTIQVTALDKYVQIEIRDTGAGIEPKLMPKLFQTFLSSSTNQQIPSSLGLGLAICQAIMMIHKGYIHIDSKPSQGTKVTLRFPNQR